MMLSAAGLAFIKGFEGFRETAYKDSNGLWACGYGHTTGVNPGDTCTEGEASAWLLADTGNAQAAVNLHVSVGLTQNQFDALTSFTYNVGTTAFIGSTLLRLLNAGQTDAAAGEFLNWDHIDGVEIAGLERRREAEMELFQT